MRKLADFTTADYLNQDAHHAVWFIIRVSFAILAVWVAVTEPWDANGDDFISVHEILLLGVRLLAFPLHLLLSLTPSAALHFVGLPDAYWPSSAIIAIVISLPLWGLLLVGGLIMEAWLEWTLKAQGNVHLD
jgi:hypothetical protein